VSELDHALIAGWPLALTVAAFLVRERVRRGRRRGALNRALHELRRPLQALALGADDASRDGGSANGDGPGKLELALAALDDLDHELNGGEPPLRIRPVVCRTWVEGALGRWRVAAGRSGSPVELRWRAGSARVLADPRRLAQALDNLIVNAIEHGGPPIRVVGSVSAVSVRIEVVDGGCGVVGPTRRPRGRRGHGLEVVARVAAQHGGRFMVSHGRRRTVAALELPLAERPAVAELPAAG
jgi:signal transduction histidine kinase